MRIPIIALSVILASVFLATAVPKLTGQADMRKRMAHLGVSVGLTRIIGVLELAAIVGLILGLFWPPAGIAAAAGLTLQMIGAVVYHLRARDGISVAAMPAAFGVTAIALVVLHVLQG